MLLFFEFAMCGAAARAMDLDDVVRFLIVEGLFYGAECALELVGCLIELIDCFFCVGCVGHWVYPGSVVDESSDADVDVLVCHGIFAFQPGITVGLVLEP